MNASSLQTSYLEPFLIDAIRAAIPKIENTELRDEAKAYLG